VQRFQQELQEIEARVDETKQWKGEGKIIHRKAKTEANRVRRRLERAREELARVRSGLSGRVALGMPPSVARMLTVPLTRAFRQQLPQAQLSISEGLSSAMQENLLSGRLDIAVLYNPSPMPGIEHRALLEEELLLVQPRPPGLQEDPPPPPLPLREVSALPLLIPSRPNAIRMLVEAQMAAIGCKPQIALEIDGVSAILDLVADGAGCAILSRNAVMRSIRPSAYATRSIEQPQLRIGLSTSASSLRCAASRRARSATAWAAATCPAGGSMNRAAGANSAWPRHAPGYASTAARACGRPGPRR
jgi:LysR family nitrogen assimilation transcriptional regulator